MISDVTDIFANSEDSEELKHTWLEWYKASGAPSRRDYMEYVQMSNEAAKLNGKYIRRLTTIGHDGKVL